MLIPDKRIAAMPDMPPPDDSGSRPDPAKAREAERAATKSRAAAIRAEIGCEPPEPVIHPRIPFPPYAPDPEQKLMNIETIIALIGAKMMRPEEMRLLGDVEIAPGVIVQARCLAWHPNLEEVVYVAPNGGYTRLERHVRAFRFGGDETCWTEAYTDTAIQLSSWRRYAVELPALMVVDGSIVKQALGDKHCYEEWRVRTSAGEFVLVAIDDPAEPPQFASFEDAIAAADSALLGEPCINSEDSDEWARRDVAMHQRWRWVLAAVARQMHDYRGWLL